MEIRATDTYLRWYRRLRDQEAQQRIDNRILRLAEGNPGDVAPVGGGISELRINYGPGYRVYYVQRGRQIIILLAGGDKDSQGRDIATARRLAREL
ncbi:MAG: type II toxin-antitoxin system RelE/ParE family toxin [Chloroflexi bacterium]|nr:type II toxin-antitoxin system RelE/ParE family toxin [Chloroflexota bacterium]